MEARVAEPLHPVNAKQVPRSCTSGPVERISFPTQCPAHCRTGVAESRTYERFA